MHSKTFYIILGCGILFIALSILVCSGLFNPYEGMNPEQYRRYNKKFLKRKPYYQNIEKNIFQTWRTKDIPDEFKYITEYLKLQNPEYNYYLYDDDDIDNFIKTYYPKYWTSYKMLAPEYGAARADFFRYMVIYHYGGVYLDIKSGASVPLRKIIKRNDEFVSSGWSFPFHPEKHINWSIIAKKNHPLLRYVLDDIHNAIQNYDVDSDGVGAMGVLKLTGPFRYSDVIEKYRTQFKIHYYPNITKSKLIYNYTFKQNADALACGIHEFTKGAIGGCNHSGSKKKYSELSIPIVNK